MYVIPKFKIFTSIQVGPGYIRFLNLVSPFEISKKSHNVKNYFNFPKPIPIQDTVTFINFPGYYASRNKLIYRIHSKVFTLSYYLQYVQYAVTCETLQCRTCIYTVIFIILNENNLTVSPKS